MLLLIDGHSLMYRAFYALPVMNDGKGRYTNALVGFFNMFLKAMDMTGATHAAVALDMHAPTFRHDKYEEYKAGRAPMPEELRPQFDSLRELLDAARIPYLQQEGFEADDFLGTYSRIAEEAGMPCRIVTGDRDSLQLVTESTHVLLTQKGLSEVTDFDPAQLMAYWNVTPEQVADLKGMMGDTSDHIPGIPGVGEKTAMKLMSQFGSLDNLYAHVDEIKGKLKDKIVEGKESAYFSRDLALIDRHAPLTRTLDECRLTPLEETDLADALASYDLMSLVKKIRPEKRAELPMYEEITLTDEGALMPVVQEWLAAGKAVAMHLGEALTLAQKDSGKVYVLPLKVDLLSEGWIYEDALFALKEVFRNLPMILHGAKAWMHNLHRLGLSIPKVEFDTEIAAYLLDSPAGKYELKDIWAKMAPDLPVHAGHILTLAMSQEMRLRAEEQWELFTQMEMPLAEILFEMEQDGFRVNAQELKRQGEGLSQRISALQEEIYSLAMERFNIQSPKQLGEVLFDKLGLPPGKKTKTGYSTSADVLENLAEDYPIVALILQYRQLTKLMGTYIEGLQALIDPKTSRIHTRFNQTLTATGRLSSAEPNLQNIPTRTPEGKAIRRAFLPKEGCVLVDADYSQIELRVLAHMADDKNLQEAFLRGDDIHAHTASQVFHVPLEEVPSDLRSAAKAVNFGIIYGISDFGLSRQLGISRKRAAEYIKGYLDTYSRVSSYMDAVIEEGRSQGYTKTLFARRRLMPDLRSRNFNIRSAAERMAMNAPIQGTAADIMKIAMIRVARALKEKQMKTRMILQVHDELILEAPMEEKEQAAELLRTAMKDAVTLCVPLNVEVTWGDSWYEAKA